MKLVALIKPKGKVFKEIKYFKKKIFNEIGYQTYLDHLPHITVFALDVNKKKINLNHKKKIYLKKIKKKDLILNIKKRFYFKNDPLTKKVTYATPKQELAALEADARLISLLDKQEQGIHLSVEQKAYVTEKLDRHAVLCSLLGIELEQEEKTIQDDPLDSLDAISMSDFIDSSDEQ